MDVTLKGYVGIDLSILQKTVWVLSVVLYLICVCINICAGQLLRRDN